MPRSHAQSGSNPVNKAAKREGWPRFFQWVCVFFSLYGTKHCPWQRHEFPLCLGRVASRAKRWRCHCYRFLQTGEVPQSTLWYGRQSMRCADAFGRRSDHRPVVLLCRMRNDGLQPEQTRFHQHRQRFCPVGHSAHEDEESTCVSFGCVLCSLSVFFRLILSFCRLYQMQWRETPKWRARSFCVISLCASTCRRNSSRSKHRARFGPGFWKDRPFSMHIQLWTLLLDTSKRRAASALLPPALTNPMTRLRISDEHLIKSG